MACRSACPTPGSHRTYGECVRASGVRVGLIDATKERGWMAEVNAYKEARRQGVQPATTRLQDTRLALDASDRLGRPYDAVRPF